MLDLAAREPTTLALGLDASAAAMAEASRRAARPTRKGGRPNARFVLASAEASPAALHGVADLVTVRFPWGSLLRGCLGRDPAAAAGVAALVASSGTLELMLAASARDGLDGLPTDVDAIVGAVACTFAPLGFALVAGREAVTAEIAALGSTWAKRLAAGRGSTDRAVTLVRLERHERR